MALAVDGGGSIPSVARDRVSGRRIWATGSPCPHGSSDKPELTTETVHEPMELAVPYSASSTTVKWISIDMGFILRLNTSIFSEEPPSILCNSNRLNSRTSPGEILGNA